MANGTGSGNGGRGGGGGRGRGGGGRGRGGGGRNGGRNGGGGVAPMLADGARSLKVTVAPPMWDMVQRIQMAPPLPLKRGYDNPKALPAKLPQIRQNRSDGRARYPKEPTSRLGLALLASLHPRIPIGEYPDLVCGTSFMHALSGNPKYAKDTFYLEWYGPQRNTLVVVHHREKSWDTASVGHRVEAWLLGKNPSKSSHASSLLQIGQYKCLVSMGPSTDQPTNQPTNRPTNQISTNYPPTHPPTTSPPFPLPCCVVPQVTCEVDARGGVTVDPSLDLVEIKSSKKGLSNILTNHGLPVQLGVGKK